MTGREEAVKKENAILRYIRETRIELRKVRWPSRESTKLLTEVVLGVTVGMALFLGALDFFFYWLFGGIIAREVLYMVLGGATIIALTVATIFIGKGEEV